MSKRRDRSPAPAPPPSRPGDSPFAFRDQDPLSHFRNGYHDAHTVLGTMGLADAPGQQSLAAAAADAGIAPQQALLELAQRLARPATTAEHDEEDYGSLGIRDLVEHISDVHHAFLRAELGRLSVLVDQLERRIDADERLTGLVRAFRRLRQNLESHMAEEEASLFPYAIRLEPPVLARDLSTDDFDRELLVMEHGHNEVRERLRDLRQVLRADDLPESVTELCALLRAGIDELARDLRAHNWKEEEYLLPAIAFAEELVDRRQHTRQRGRFDQG